MAAFANMTIADGQSTPANHTFTKGALRIEGDGRLYNSWMDFSVNGGIPIGANRIEQYARLPKFGRAKKAGEQSQLLSVDYKVVVPTLETLSNNTSSGINPQATLAYETTFFGKLVRNGRADAQPVKDALAFQRGFTQQAQFTDTVLNYSPPSA